MILAVIKETYFSRNLDFRVRLFNVLAMTGMALSFITGVASIIRHEGLFSTITNFSTTVIAGLLMHYASKSGRYLLCYIIAVITIFMIAFSVLFFMSGGYESAMPSYFIFAVIITVFMLEGKLAIITTSAELLLYVFLCVYAYLFPRTITTIGTRLDMLVDVIIGFTVVSVSLGAAMFLHFRMYNKQQRELEEAREQALALNRMKTEFLGNISHELKTPLTVISGYAQLSEQLLGTPGEPSAAAEKMKFISSEAERLALMVSQVLDLTQIEEGRMIVNIEPCYAEEIIHSAIETHFPILNKNDNRLEIRIDENLPMIKADPLRISRVIVNLTANAIRFTTAGAICVSAGRKGAFVEISVADTGSGISPERLPHIFERYNIQKSGDGRDTGTGLGLFICKHIVEEHGGEITVESEQGKGTVVRFTIPCEEEFYTNDANINE